MISCLVIAWLLLATITVVVAGVVAVGLAIALTSALLQAADALATMIGLALSDGVLLYDLARGLAIGAVVAGALAWVDQSM